MDALINIGKGLSACLDEVNRGLDAENAAAHFLRKTAFGGCIVSTCKCSEVEITQARVCNRYFELDTLGYVYRPAREDALNE